MIKSKGESQIENLTFDHKSLQSRGQMMFHWGHALHCWKDRFEGYKIESSHFQKKIDLRKL
jgi:hypothetical protein